MILLPLRPVSPTHTNPQRRTKFHDMRLVGCKDRSIDRSPGRCFGKISCSCDFCGCSCGRCLTTHISFSLRCSLQKNIFYLSGHIKDKAFSISDLLFSELRLNGSGLGLTICSQDESHDSP